MHSHWSLEMPSKYTKKHKKNTNNKKVPNYTWTPSSEQYQPSYPYSREFPIPHKVTNADLGIVINKKLKTSIPLKNTYVVICKYDQCKRTWGTWKKRRPFYSFNTNHHRKVHGHQPYKLQIVSRLFITKYKYKQEYAVTYDKPNSLGIYFDRKPTHFLSMQQRTINVMTRISYFADLYLCKKP